MQFFFLSYEREISETVLLVSGVFYAYTWLLYHHPHDGSVTRHEYTLTSI